MVEARAEAASRLMSRVVASPAAEQELSSLVVSEASSTTRRTSSIPHSTLQELHTRILTKKREEATASVEQEQRLLQPPRTPG